MIGDRASLRLCGAVLLALSLPGLAMGAQEAPSAKERVYYGFDKNEYPGDALLSRLHRTFAFTGYWLNDPPGMKTNPWAGKRSIVRAAGFGFLILFNGRLDAQLTHRDAPALGRADGNAAAAAARREGFPSASTIYLDQEEGGALLDEQAAYLGAWIAGVDAAGYRAGVYCSGIPARAGRVMISTAQDVARRFPNAKLWVANDECPPAPGCTLPRRGLNPAMSRTAQAEVWQYAQSPRRKRETKACRATYAANGNCYAPGLPHSEATFIDLNVSRSPDPSHGR